MTDIGPIGRRVYKNNNPKSHLPDPFSTKRKLRITTLVLKNNENSN